MTNATPTANLANTALALAMANAGVTALITVDRYTDRTDSYADYAGWRVQASTDELRLRGAKWLRAWLGARGVQTDADWTDGDLDRNIPGRGYECIRGCPKIPTEVYARFIRTARYSLGD